MNGVRELVAFLIKTPDAPIESGDMRALVGLAQSLCSVARLLTGPGQPLVLLTEYMSASFLDQFPPPWPWPSQAVS